MKSLNDKAENTVMEVPLPRGAVLVEVVRIRRSHAQAEGKEEGKDSFWVS